ncbi:sulfatase family protein [Saccharicrinis sp. 156]|uniref:sulfatase family protein n=1 Tax=Saccharicrinis sp. 156 TaxID=3417574 RepID=UPI003D3517D5
MKQLILTATALFLLGFIPMFSMSQTIQKPNIIYILADDLGYGDVHHLNPERGKIATPHIDKMAEEGMFFTDAHSSSSVCTPTRYGILTGRYNWRTNLQRGVLWGFSEPLIDSDRITVANVMKQNGYTTACFGKWHLGMTMPTTNGILPQGRKPKKLNIVWDEEIKDGPVDRGFDYFHGISASLDMAPYIYIENNRFVGKIEEDDKTITEKDFKRVEVLPEICRKTVDYIRKQKQDKPFFAYVALTSPHTPILPGAEWQGKSGLGKYGDFVMQTDWVVGQILKAVDDAGLGENTLVIVTSDNGCSKAANIKGLQEQGHYPSAQYRGSKADIWDGGHRIPFIVRWPANVKAGSSSNQLLCLTDLMATCADITGSKLPDNAGEDSFSFLPALKGKKNGSERESVVHHSIDGYFAYRQGKWKLVLAKGSGGWTSPREKEVPEGSPEAQLYDMEKDPEEMNNLYDSHPKIVNQLLQQLQSDVTRGRSTEGTKVSNDIENIEIWKNKQTE